MQVLRIENPLWVPGLRLAQRLGYAATLLGWFDSWRTLGLLLLPPAVLLTGQIPIVADGVTFLAFFGVTYALQQAALFLLGRGAYRPILSVIFDLVRMTPNIAATLTLVRGRRPKFMVTPKGRMATRRGRVEAPKPLRAVLGVSVIGALVARSTPLVSRETHLLTFMLPSGATSLWATVRSSRVAPDGAHHYAFEFDPGQFAAKGELARAVFDGRYPVAGVERKPWAEL